MSVEALSGIKAGKQKNYTTKIISLASLKTSLTSPTSHTLSRKSGVFSLKIGVFFFSLTFGVFIAEGGVLSKFPRL